jgi:hypothetical protein
MARLIRPSSARDCWSGVRGANTSFQRHLKGTKPSRSVRFPRLWFDQFGVVSSHSLALEHTDHVAAA